MDTKQITDQIRDIIEKECLYLSTHPEDVITERFNNQNRSIDAGRTSVSSFPYLKLHIGQIHDLAQQIELHR